MKILVLGGTGAMGQELVPLLAQNTKNEVVVTSRKKNSPQERIEYIQGNAKNIIFIKSLLENNRFDVIVDFMLYSVDEFKSRYQLLLNSCEQYIFFSSARVYAASDQLINENSARLLDVSTDKEFIAHGEYSLTKAIEEDILKNSTLDNWVIIRPYKTYSNSRLQLGVLEMNQWFYRAISGKPVVALGNIKNLHTSLTYSKDTAKILLHIVGNYSYNREIFQIANPEKVTWGDIIQIYSKCIENVCGKKMNVYYVKDTTDCEILFNNKYRIKYDGLIDRLFDDSKVISIMGGRKQFVWTPLNEGLAKCVHEAIEMNLITTSGYNVEGCYDRITGQYTPLSRIKGNKNRFTYLVHRTLGEKTIHEIKKYLYRRTR